jgi:hypothetical protein
LRGARLALAAFFVVMIAASAACGEEDAAVATWTVREAESISSVRGLPVRVRECRGLGAARRDGGSARFARFACVAGGRSPGEPFDTVAVLYELRVLGEYEGRESRYVLENVRFIGGPGIP